MLFVDEELSSITLATDMVVLQMEEDVLTMNAARKNAARPLDNASIGA